MSPRQHLLNLIIDSLSHLTQTSEVYGQEFAMEPDKLVGYRAKLQLESRWLRLDVSTAASRPPFEWSGEISIDGPSGFDHFLVRDNDVVRAIRKDITVLNDAEIQELIQLMIDLQAELQQAGHWSDEARVLSL